MRALALLVLLAAPAAAQQFGVTPEGVQPLPDFSQNAQDEVLNGAPRAETLTVGPGAGTAPRSAPAVATRTAPGAILRGLDKITGETTDYDLDNGDTARIGRLTVEMDACRYPAENPSGDAFALVTVTADGQNAPWFRGWMIASSPALSALDHPRYDIWVMRCRSS